MDTIKEVDLTRITEEQVWLLYCLAQRLAAMKPPAPRTAGECHETAFKLVADIDALCIVNKPISEIFAGSSAPVVPHVDDYFEQMRAILKLVKEQLP